MKEPSNSQPRLSARACDPRGIGEILHILDRSNADAIIRRPEVRMLTGLSDSTIDRLVTAGANGNEFPAPVSLTGSRAVGWRLSEILRWVATRPAANDASTTPRRPTALSGRGDTRS
jgi:predicted DNA-binding transcriptional regulator AlpA